MNDFTGFRPAGFDYYACKTGDNDAFVEWYRPPGRGWYWRVAYEFKPSLLYTAAQMAEFKASCPGGRLQWVKFQVIGRGMV